MDASAAGPIDLHTDRPHAARVYDFVLGGKTNYPADREAGRKTLEALPTAGRDARENRGFMRRAVTIAAEAGIRQFFDVGTGIPTSPNVHEVAQGIAPESRVVYTDNDPIVLAHSRALHASTPEGRTTYLQADAGDPDTILRAPGLRETLDLGEPVALSLLLLLHWLPGDPYAVVRRLMDALAPGSYLIITHLASDIFDGVAGVEKTFVESGTSLRARSGPEVQGFFDGLELLEPGVVPCNLWRPALAAVGSVKAFEVPVYGGVAVKR
ncbi:SAM-dependent methyltransferase [Streptomyces sp. NBC_01497]|uniref:SAM-dependent methyltransferase n=1 Tax=Streptomyces sp. NBC_01497 TaxID=2903885 RepID=UPI002E2F96EB|nr:SAM-dependent methyltransferase [Streptomyces sp. NBC_01497]